MNLEIHSPLTDNDLQNMGVDIPSGMQTDEEAQQEQADIAQEQEVSSK